MNNDEIMQTSVSTESAAPSHENDLGDFESGFDAEKTIVRETIRETPIEAETQQANDGFAVVFKEPKRLALFILSIVIALALIISGSILIGTKSDSRNTTDNGSEELYKTITVDTPMTVYVNNYNYQYFKFEPKTSGYYSFYTVSSKDTYGLLRDGNFIVLTSDDNSGTGNNFNISQYLYSGSTYYIGVKSNENSFTATLYVIKG